MPKDFARDLGYLAKFLQDLRAHAATLGAPAGPRLMALLDSEDAAWAEIRALLEGQPAGDASVPNAEAPARAAVSEHGAPKPVAPPLMTSGEATMRRLTVGSLLP